MALGAFIPIIIWVPMSEFVKAVLIGSGIVVIFGLVDDIREIGFKTKFIGQIFAGLIVILYGGLNIQSLGMFAPSGFLLPEWLSIPLTLIVIVAVTNAINLSDGLDGLAGGVGLLTFLCIGYLSYLNQFQAYEIISVAMIGAIFGLLRYNTHPAIVFMGDAGSQLLGFVAITLSLALTSESNQISLVLVVLIMGIPVIDTLFVMIQRIIKGRSPFTADKNHLHYKIMNLGFYHSESVLLIYLFHGILVCIGVFFRVMPPWFLLCLYILLSGVLMTTISIAEINGWKIKRYDFIDRVIKGRLRILKEENIIIKVSFKAVEVGFIFILIFTCFLPKHINTYFSLCSIVLLGLILLTRKINKKWASSVIDISIFLMIPFLVYFSEKDVVYLIDTTLIKAYVLSFGLLIFFVLLTLKFTRRKGFKPTPMDFLILVAALVVPNLPDEKIKSWQMGLIAAKIIAMFFTYEILKGELRLNTKKLEVAAFVALLVISIRGFIG
jgi:UDP-GlcNAc:undecaprenyl-phosphate GlcNAc-1-phosphate transferase